MGGVLRPHVQVVAEYVWLFFFLVVLRKMREKDPDNEIREAFRVFDAEGAGYIGQKYWTFKMSTNSSNSHIQRQRR